MIDNRWMIGNGTDADISVFLPAYASLYREGGSDK